MHETAEHTPGGGRTRILIVDDHAVVRKGLAMVLRLESDFDVVGEAGDGRQALEVAKILKPDVVLLDLIMPVMDGLQTARAFHDSLPEVRLLVLSGAVGAQRWHDRTGSHLSPAARLLDDGLIEMLAAGVDGYVLKDVEPDELTEAIRAVARGEAYLHPAVTRQVLDRLAGHTPLLSRDARRTEFAHRRSPAPEGRYANGVRPSPLRFTPRELEILRFMATPSTYREIAEQLSISEETVRSHAKRVLNKLGQPNRVQAVLAAVRSGLIQIPDVEEE